MSSESKKRLVLVEAVSLFRNRYVVECPEDHPEYALDTVVMGEAKTFSSEHVGETVVSHRVVGEAEALEICDADNDYGKDWDSSTKKENFFTTEDSLK